MVYNNTPCYLFSFSNEGYITRINNTLLEHLEYERSEVVGNKKIEDLLTVGSRIFFQTHFYPLIKMQGKANEIFLSFRSQSGKDLPVLLNVVLDNFNESFEIHCGGMQISNRNRFEKEILEAKNIAEAALIDNKELLEMRNSLQEHQQTLEIQLRQLAQKNRQQNEINKVLSHDLQEPLRKISFFSDRLLHGDGNALTESASTSLERIITSIEKVRNLLDSLQRFNSLDDKQLKFIDIHFEKVLQDALVRSELIGRDDVIISHGELPVFQADEYLITALFAELLCNAFKFRKENIPLEISISAVKMKLNSFIELENKYLYTDFIRIIFTDNATGIVGPAEKVFDIFRKASYNTVGVGMGLTFCRKIVELHKGTITVESEGGRGTTFTILLPVSEI